MSSRSRSIGARALLVLVGVLATNLVVTSAATSAGAMTETTFTLRGAAYAQARGYRVGIAVLDTATGHYFHGGSDTGVFASESVVKTMIATRLLVTGQMADPAVRATAWKMITRSDDFAATSLYGRVGGDSLIDWIRAYYHVPFLGYRPSRAGWWGNTHITPRGLVYFYAAVKRDKRVAPWLFDAMRHITVYGSDYQYQYFGIPSATSGAAVKQGWGNDIEGAANASFNTTGMVDRDRYAVAVLMRGPAGTYGRPISDMLTAVARIVLPGRHVYDPALHDPRLSVAVRTTGSTVSISGTAYDPDNPIANMVAVYEGSRRLEFAHASHRRFAYSFPASNARHRYCVRVLNAGPGSDVTRCTTVTVNGAPFGILESVTSPTAGSVRLVGWAADRDDVAAPVSIRVSEDGVILGYYPTDVVRSDIDSARGLSGAHGFDVTLTDRTPGGHVYRAVAVNIGYAGPPVQITHSPVTVTVTAPPEPAPSPSAGSPSTGSSSSASTGP